MFSFFRRLRYTLLFSTSTISSCHFFDERLQVETVKTVIDDDGSEPTFFNNGKTIADLSCAGKTPVAKTALTRSAMTGAKDGRISWSRLVGIGSRGHVDFEDLLMMDMTSEDVVGLKESNFEEDGTSREFSGGQ